MTTTIEWFGFGNIGSTPYCAALFSDGSMLAINGSTGATLTIFPAGTILNPSTYMGFSQWGSQYFIFAKDQTNGYWLWDGTNLYEAGTVGPVVTLTSSGMNFTAAPEIIPYGPYGGAETGDSYSAQLDNTSVSLVTVESAGSGFGIGDVRGLQFVGTASRTAVAHASIVNGAITGITVQQGGSGFMTVPGIVIAAPPAGGSQAFGYVSSMSAGSIQAITISDPGFGYQGPPAVTTSGGGGSTTPVILNAIVEDGVIDFIAVDDGGMGYTEAPVVLIFGDGTGATATAVFNAADNGIVGKVMVNNFSGGYTPGKVTIAFEGGGNNVASGYVQAMPYGLSGTSVEIYQSRVWIANGAAVASFPPLSRIIFSAPGSPVDFGDGGGAFLGTDSFIRVGYRCLKQSNGFLYLIGDSSINYVSGVQTATATGSTTPITTFSNQNVDPQIGSPWPQSVQVFSRNIVFANRLGVFVSYGGAVTKISDPLDGFYTSVPKPATVIVPTAAVAEIFGIQVYMLLFPVIDLYTGQQVNKLLMWDGKKWWTSQQDQPLVFIATRELNSQLMAYGTDGNSIWPLFQTPSNVFQKVAQSKLWAKPHYLYRKTETMFYGIGNYYSSSAQDAVYLTAESEVAANAVTITSGFSENVAVWTNNSDVVVQWTNNSSVVVQWGTPGAAIFGPQRVGPVLGRVMGMTAATYAADFAIISLTTTGQVQEAKV